MIGSLTVRVLRGVNLAARDLRTSDPYVVVTLDDRRVKTKVKKRCLNPEWNEELNFTVRSSSSPIKLEVFDRDRFSKDDRIGEAVIDIEPLLAASRQSMEEEVADGVTIKKVPPTLSNYLATESRITLWGHLIVQDLIVRLGNVETGEVELQLQYAQHKGFKHY